MKAKLQSELRKKSATEVEYEVMGEDDLRALGPGSRVYFVTRYGTLAQAKVTSVRSWKTRPHNLTVNLKYGLYEYFAAHVENGQCVGETLVKLV